MLNILSPEICQNCDSLHCHEHIDDVNEYAMNICEAVNTAAKQCLPAGGGAIRQPGGKYWFHNINICTKFQKSLA